MSPAVFDKWAELMPYMQTGANGRIWQDAAKALESKQAGMMFQGTNQVAAQYVTDKANLADLDFFLYPAINPQYGQDYMDAPADGFMLARRRRTGPAKKVLEYIGTGRPPRPRSSRPTSGTSALANGANVPTYNAIQKKSVQVIGQAKEIAQFMDRDSDPASPTAMVAQAIQTFLQTRPRRRSRPSRAARGPGEDRSSRADDRSRPGAVARPRRRRILGSGGGCASVRPATAVRWPSCSASRCSLLLAFIWFPALATVGLSFTNWNGRRRLQRRSTSAGSAELPIRLHRSTRSSGRPCGTT